MKVLCFAAGFLAFAQAAQAETPVLDVLTYDIFVAEWGPGPAIEKAFEAECGCDLRFTPAGDGAALLARLLELIRRPPAGAPGNRIFAAAAQP